MSSPRIGSAMSLPEAARIGSWLDVMAHIIDGVDVDRADEVSGWAPLHYAVQNGQLRIVQVRAAPSRCPRWSASGAIAALGTPPPVPLAPFTLCLWGLTVRCARAVRNVGYFGPVFPDGPGVFGNYCVPKRRTAQIPTQSNNSDHEH